MSAERPAAKRQDSNMMRAMELNLDAKQTQAQAWLDSHLPHDMTEPECVPCQMATNVILLAKTLREEYEAFANRVVDQLEPFPGDECCVASPSNMGPCQKREGHGGCHGALDGSYGWR